ncbi:hypothetical protein, partial [Xenorhabdus japonica]|uniref:hypothetical protein n=1 Tax=Xenorhabdus japonica TaxID=53341 RepID=UPI001C319988
AFSVKPYFSGPFTLSSRQVCVFVVTTDAHYREFSAAGNSFFEFYFQMHTFRSHKYKNHSNSLKLMQIFSLHGIFFLNNISI